MKRKVVIVGWLVAMSLSSAAAEEFYFVSKSGRKHGPFTLADGATVVLEGRSYRLQRVAGGASTEDAARRQKVTAKLKRIVIPQVDFRQAHVSDVVEFLRKASVERDPEKTGVNIVLKIGPRPPPKGLDDPFSEARDWLNNPPLITFTARQLSLYDTLQLIGQVSNLEIRIMSWGVLVTRPERSKASQ